jgi:hypothetical protein
MFLLEFDNYIVIYVFHVFFFFNRHVNSKSQDSFTDASALFP